MPIRWKLPLLFSGLALALAIAVFSIAYREVRESAIGTVEHRLREAAGGISERLEEQVRQTGSRLRVVASRPAVAAYLRDPNPLTLAAFEEALGTVRPGVGSSYWLDVVHADGTLLPASAGDRPALGTLSISDFLRLEHGPDSAGVGELRRLDSALVYPIVVAVNDANGTPGHLAVWQRVAPGSAQISLISQLVGDDSRLLLGSVGGGWTDEFRVLDSPGFELGNGGDVYQFRDSLGEGWVAIAAGLVPTPWVVVLAAPERAVLAPVRRFVASAGLASVAVVVLGLGVGTVLTRRIIRPLEDLTRAAAAMGEGEHQIRVAVSSGDEVGQLAATFNTMAERVDEEVQATASLAHQWQLLFVDNPHPMWVFDQKDHGFLAVNTAAVVNYGWTQEEFLGMSVDGLWPPEETPGVDDILSADTTEPDHSVRCRHRRKDGTHLDAEVWIRSLRFAGRGACVMLAQDITERQALERAVRQSQKMDAIGRLAGGIAHDFNNYLAVVMTYAEMAREGLAETDPLVADLTEISSAAERAHGLTRQLLAFARQDVVQQADIEPVAVVKRLEGMLQRVLGERIKVECRTEGQPSWVRIDPGQFEQVLVNLAVNARDAMPDGGRLVITMAEENLDALSARLHGVPEPGRFVTLSVSDNGIGMSPEVRARIFEPFFTTKDVGRGTGLGLATVYGIIHQAGGSVTVYSEVGEGTTFRIYMPARAAGAVPAQTPEASAPLPRGSETILLVEDDAAVRNAATAALNHLGYVVLNAQGAEDALAQVERLATPVDLVLSDVVMPDTDGPALVRQLMEKRPGMVAILMSGYAGDVVSTRGGLGADITFLAKPFTVTTLARVVREVLDRRTLPAVS